ncbi:V-type sodium pump subunit C [Urinicoccus massiliensis]|uniref:V-type sodium pump subunit C n=1 Tax=Urinicoccus massiliensis TaxID=1723382 RepID=A0A8H2MDC2_9FIRM|nr:V-type ATP synthase subunit C [Urinicoccus massiliensis]VFB15635.1 V-type sodium pump subunit C [Urinicoccus massiliensis]
MDRSKFIQASARIRVLEKKLLNQASYQRLVESKSLSEALHILSDSVYQTAIHSLGNDRDYEYVLKQELVKTFKDLYEISPDPGPVDLLSVEYYYHNLKVLAKESMTQQDLETSYVSLGLLDIKKAQDLLNNHEGKIASKSLSRAIKIVEEAMAIYEEWSDPQDIDLYIDRAQIQRMQELVDEMDVDMFRDYIKAYIDFSNIGTFFRNKTKVMDLKFLQKVLYDGGEIPKKDYYDYLNAELDSDSKIFTQTKIAKYVRRGLDVFDEKNSLGQLEAELNRYCMDLIKQSKTMTYGPEVIFSYGLAKEMEIKNLRLILIAKANDIPSESIKERLRDSYV